MLHAVSDPIQLAQLIDPGMCHGWAGVAATLWCAARDSPRSDLTASLPHLTESLLDAAVDPGPEISSGLIDGSAGVALTLHGLATGNLDGWTRCLLLT